MGEEAGDALKNVACEISLFIADFWSNLGGKSEEARGEIKVGDEEWEGEVGDESASKNSSPWSSKESSRFADGIDKDSRFILVRRVKNDSFEWWNKGRKV